MVCDHKSDRIGEHFSSRSSGLIDFQNVCIKFRLNKKNHPRTYLHAFTYQAWLPKNAPRLEITLKTFQHFPIHLTIHSYRVGEWERNIMNWWNDSKLLLYYLTKWDFIKRHKHYNFNLINFSFPIVPRDNGDEKKILYSHHFASAIAGAATNATNLKFSIS